MHILYIHQYFKTPTEPGGTRSYWFAKELIKNGHKVTMLTCRSNQSKFLEKSEIDGISVIYIKNAYDNKMGLLKRLFSYTRFMFSSTFIGLKQEQVDLVFATSTPLSVAVPALILKWINGKRFIFEVRDLWPEVPIQMGAIKNKMLINLFYRFEKKIYKSASHIIALSPGMEKGVLKYNISPKKISMIPNMSKKNEFYQRAPNLEIATKFGIDKGKFNVVHFGSMGIANGLTYIIDAAILLKKSGYYNKINFVFLGEGKTEHSLKMHCAEHELSNVQFLGAHSMPIVSEIVNLCDCSLVTFSNIPILYTNSPNKLFDSLSAGKPVIVNSPGWTKEMVESHKCGIYVSPGKSSELADSLIKMFEDPEWVKEMGNNSRWLAENVYDKSILCKQLVEIVENVKDNH
jgi:glycosyltransferase involved in cell wall biosynthesis